MTESVMPTYGRLDITFAKGEGAWLTDTRGERYLDALSGIAVCNLGHCHPAVTRAISEQASTLIHTSNMYHNAKVQAGFEPLLPGFVRVPYNDIDAVRMAVSHWPEAVAVLVEPVQGEGGIKVPDSEYLSAIRDLCTQRKLLMMLDEVQTGVGRTGKWFAYQHKADLLPDVMTLAKGLGNGMPVGACLVAGLAKGVLQAGNHGSTFGGNPLACSAALAVLETIEKEQLLGHVSRLGEQMFQQFKQQLGKTEGVKEVRHLGFMFGIELTTPCAELVKLALQENILINVTSEKVIRLLPPMIINAEEAVLIVNKVSQLIKTFLATRPVESVA